jgi:hypothetical protein
MAERCSERPGGGSVDLLWRGEETELMRKRQPGREGLQESDWMWRGDESQMDWPEGGYEELAAGDDGEEHADMERHSLIEKLIGRIGAQLESTEAPSKASVTDLIRLMQLEREMNPRQARRFVVEWVDPKPEAL